MDRQLVVALEAFLRPRFVALHHTQIVYRIKDAGLGMGSAVLRGEAAFVVDMEANLKPLLRALGHTTVKTLRSAWR